jgi:hypothetical protein
LERIVRNRDTGRLRGGVHMSLVTVGACSLLLFAAGTSCAQAHDGAEADGGPSSGGWGWPDRDLGGILNPVFVCKQTVECVMGPVNSGNPRGGQNVWLKGNVNDSGSPGNINGSINVDNTNNSGINHDIHIQQVSR